MSDGIKVLAKIFSQSFLEKGKIRFVGKSGVCSSLDTLIASTE